jgi:hypothetical protein
VNAVNQLKQQKDELERQRQMLVMHLYELLDDLEGPSAPRRRTSRFPFNLLENVINASLLSLERAVDKLVTAAFSVRSRR